MNIRRKVRACLEQSDRKGLIELLESDRKTVSAINRHLFDVDPLIGWRAVQALGWVAAHDPYSLEKSIGRLMYTMNDDSGSIGWRAPQALGEICANDPDLVEDFFPIVISSIENPVFTSGVLWAIGRVAGIRPDLVEEAGPDAAGCLKKASAETRGLACRAVGRIPYYQARPDLERLTRDRNLLTVFENDQLIEKSVGDLAREALARLDS